MKKKYSPFRKSLFICLLIPVLLSVFNSCKKETIFEKEDSSASIIQAGTITNPNLSSVVTQADIIKWLAKQPSQYTSLLKWDQSQQSTIEGYTR